MTEPVIPVLVYQNIEAAHDFLVAAFGFESGGLARDSDGQVIHGEVRVGGVPIWLHRVTVEHGLDSPQSGGRASSGLVVYVADIDAHFARAQAAGARIESEPQDQPYGQREYGARDPEDHRWWFAAPIPAPPAP